MGKKLYAEEIVEEVKRDWQARREKRKALELHRRLYCFFRDQFIETNPIPIKAAMAMAGLIREEYRLPLCELSAEHREKLAATLKRCGIIR